MLSISILTSLFKLRDIRFIAILLCSLMLQACGGGGGGGEDPKLKAAEVSLDIQPSSVGLGDRIYVSIRIDSVDENGVIIKLRYPAALSYVRDTSILRADGEHLDWAPLKVEKSNGSLNYLGFYIPREAFGDGADGWLEVYLRAISVTESGEIEVDSQVHNSGADPVDEYSVKTPLFSAVDTFGFEVYE